MPVPKKRRSENNPSPSPPPTRRRRAKISDDEDSEDSDDDYDGQSTAQATGTGGKRDHGVPTAQIERMAAALVRLALAAEHNRVRLRREDISAKVLAPDHTRRFKPVLAAAQRHLRTVFGVELVPLPQRERVTVAQRRAAQKQASNRAGGGAAETAGPARGNDADEEDEERARGEEGGESGGGSAPGEGGKAGKDAEAGGAGDSGTYMLRSVLPARYRGPAIVAPQRMPSTAAEAAYTGFYSFVVSLIYLSPGQRMAEGRLERSLRAVYAEDAAPAGVLGGGDAGEWGEDKTDRVLKKMEREGYVVRVRERGPAGGGGADGEEVVEYMVGPRGKREIGEEGVAGMVRRVYGKTDHEMVELEEKLENTLGKGSFTRQSREEAASSDEESRAGTARPEGGDRRRRSARAR